MSYDKKREEAHYQETVRGALKGAAIGLGVSLPLSLIANRRWTAYRQLTLPLKAFGIVGATTAGLMIGGDKAGRAFEESQWHDRGAKVLERKLSKEEEAWEKLGPKDKILTYAKQHRWSIIVGGWAASLAGSFAYIHRQPLSFSQKLVQARVYAQALTVAVLIASAAVMQIPSAGDTLVEQDDPSEHSWRQFIDEGKEGQQKGDAAMKANAAQGSSAARQAHKE